MHSLPIFARLTGRPVILIGGGDAADAKRRLLERAGAQIVGEENTGARFAIVVDDEAAVVRLKARGVLVNAVDRPELCDFTLPAIVDRDPVLIAIGTGGASAGLAAALRQKLEAMLPASLGGLARALQGARTAMRVRWPGADQRRRALADAFAGPLDPFTARDEADVALWLDTPDTPRENALVRLTITSPDPDDLTLRAARALASADRVYHGPSIAPAILARARADAVRTLGLPPSAAEPGLTVVLEAAS